MKENIIHLMVNDNQGNPLTDINNHTIKKIMSLFGGCTIIEAQGQWMNDEGTIFLDKALRVIVSFDVTQENKTLFLEVAELYKVQAKQECVYIVLDNEVKFI